MRRCRRRVYQSRFSLKLYRDYLLPLKERALYCDTDSVVFITGEGQWEPPLDSTSETKGVKIVEFWSTGTKSYGYKLENNKLKIKMTGVTLDNPKVAKQFNYELDKSIVLNNSTKVNVQFTGIRRHNKFGIDTRELTKAVRFTRESRANWKGTAFRVTLINKKIIF